MKDLIGLSREELLAEMTALGEKPFRVKQLWQWLYNKGERDFSKMSSLSKDMQKKLAEHYFVGRPSIETERNSADKTFNVMSLTAGYTYKKGSTATIQFDKNNPMDLFTSDDTAWTNTAKTDAAITKQMRAGNVAVIKGKSSLGTLTTDTFSLKGFTKANDAIAKACPRKK